MIAVSCDVGNLYIAGKKKKKKNAAISFSNVAEKGIYSAFFLQTQL